MTINLRLVPAAMLNDRFIELLTKQLSSEISEEEFQEFQELLADDESNRQQYGFFKDYWKQKNQYCPNSEQTFDKIKSRITADGETGTLIRFPITERRNKV